MIVERYRRGKKRLERGLIDSFSGGALVTGVEIIVEEGAEIDLVERVGGRGWIDRFSGRRIGAHIGGRLRSGSLAEKVGDIPGGAVGAGGIHHGVFEDVVLWVQDPLAF